MPGTEKRNLKTDGALLFRKKKKKKSFFLPIHSRFFPAPHNLDHEPVGAISL